MEKLVTHDGVVIAVSKKRVQVKMEIHSACASCEAHSKCGFAESKDKVVDIDTDEWQQYHVGENVSVEISANRGMQAVFIAYVLPSIVLLGTFIVLCLLHLSEGAIALITLLSVGLYAVVLYFFRNRLQKKFILRISHVL